MEFFMLLERLEACINSATRVPGTKRVLVDGDKIKEIVQQLRLSLPKEVREAGEMLQSREKIFAQAHLEARRIKATADAEARARLQHTEIVKDAKRKAQEIIEEAQRRAERIVEQAELFSEQRRSGARQYAREVLTRLESQVASISETIRHGLEILDSEQLRV